MKIALACALVVASLELIFRLNGWAAPLVQSAMGSGWVASIVLGWLAFAAAALPLWLAESTVLWRRKSLERDWFIQSARGAGFWLLAMAAGVLFGQLAYKLMISLGIQPAFVIVSDASLAAMRQDVPWAIPIITALALYAYMVVFDCFYYWFHRAQHGLGPLWRFHRVHHAIRSLSSANSYHHVLEEFFRIPLVVLPLALLVRVGSVDVVPVVSACIAAWGYYIHCKLPLNIGSARMWVGDNFNHHVHHSTALEHRDRNFAAFFPWWDRLFGTFAPVPSNALDLSLGLEDELPAQNPFQYVFCKLQRPAALPMVPPTGIEPVSSA